MIIQQANRLNTVSEYYFSKKLQQIRDMQADGKDVINLGIGNPDMPPSKATVNKLIETAQLDNVHGYQNYRCVPELRKAIADWYNKIYSVRLDFNTEVLPLIGSKEGITHISFAFLNPDDEVLVPNPGYPAYTSVARLAEAKIRYYNLNEDDNWQIDISELQKMDLSKVKIMWVNYPNMPTGSLGSAIMFEQLIALAKKHKFLIINDNPYSLVLNDNPTSILSFDGAKEVALELNSLSKSHNMAGWRIGWISGKQEYIDTILKVKSNVDSGMFLPLQLAAAEAFNNSAEWHKKRNDEYAKRRTLVYQIFDTIKCTYDKNQVGMFIWAKVPDSVINTGEFVESILQNKNVFITPGFIFGTNGERYLRISLASKYEKIEEAFERIKN